MHSSRKPSPLRHLVPSTGSYKRCRLSVCTCGFLSQQQVLEAGGCALLAVPMPVHSSHSSAAAYTGFFVQVEGKKVSEAHHCSDRALHRGLGGSPGKPEGSPGFQADGPGKQSSVLLSPRAGPCSRGTVYQLSATSPRSTCIVSRLH